MKTPNKFTMSLSFDYTELTWQLLFHFIDHRKGYLFWLSIYYCLSYSTSDGKLLILTIRCASQRTTSRFTHFTKNNCDITYIIGSRRYYAGPLTCHKATQYHRNKVIFWLENNSTFARYDKVKSLFISLLKFL